MERESRAYLTLGSSDLDETACRLGIRVELVLPAAHERIPGCEDESCAGKLLRDRSYFKVSAKGVKSRVGCCEQCARRLRDRLIAELDPEPFDEMTGPMDNAGSRVASGAGEVAGGCFAAPDRDPPPAFDPDDPPERFQFGPVGCTDGEHWHCRECKRAPEDCLCDRRTDLDDERAREMDDLRDQFLGEREPVSAVADGGGA